MKMILVTMMAIALTIGAQAQEEPVDTSLFQPRLRDSFQEPPFLPQCGHRSRTEGTVL